MSTEAREQSVHPNPTQTLSIAGRVICVDPSAVSDGYYPSFVLDTECGRVRCDNHSGQPVSVGQLIEIDFWFWIDIAGVMRVEVQSFRVQ